MAQGEVPLRRTPLYALHVRLGARMVPFAGYEMPLQYPGGIIAEHLHTRAAASLFDVSHMGQIVVRPRSGRIEDAARALETLVPGDILALAPGRQRYTLLTNDAGGVRDDIMVSHQHDHLAVVVNAACKEADEAHLRASLGDTCEVDDARRPRAGGAAGPARGGRAGAARARGERHALHGCPVDRHHGRAMPREPVRLHRRGRFRDRHSGGARGSILRGAARGRERRHGRARGARHACGSKRACVSMAPTSIPRRRRSRRRWNGPSRRRAAPAVRAQAAFPARSVSSTSSPTVRRAGGSGSSRRAGRRCAPTRPLFRDEAATEAIGMVTSGGFGPSLDAPIAMGYVSTSCAPPGTPLFAEVRGKRLPVAVAALPFVAPHYKRR